MKNLMNAIENKKHVIWDWNGTVVDDVDPVVQILNDILDSKAMPRVTVEIYKDLFGFPVKNFYEKIGFDFSNSEYSFADLSHQFHDHYMSRLHSYQIFSHSKKIIEHVKQSQKTQSILSASEQGHLNKSLDFFNLKNYFDHVYGIADHFAASKLERGRQLLSHSKIQSADTILIGDTDHDLEVGRELGIDVVLLAHGHQSHERLQKIHDQVFLVEHNHLKN